jgi:phosphatidate cytidylyltransferase
MPEISPKKTIAGAVTGLAGSCVGGLVFLKILLPEVPALWIVLFTLICGMMAQAGDLFVSLVKRVAEVKDSGRIMPGHGGVLDRLDGIYMAAPLVYAFARICEYHFVSL